jgi:heme a synthase
MSNAAESSLPAPMSANTWRRNIHRLAIFVVLLAFMVIFLGGKTKSKEAGLTIPEPVIFTWEPKWLMIENLSAEYSHRIAVALLSVGALALTVWIHISDKRSYARKLSLWMMALLLAQAVLGALTVHFFARASTSIPHAVLGQTVFTLTVCLAIVTSQAWFNPAPVASVEEHPGLRRIALYLMIALFIQLLLGAALRHDNKGEALRNGNISIFIWHLVAHLVGAFAVLVCAARAISRIFRNFRHVPSLMTPARLIMILLTLQLALGIGAALLKIMHSTSYDDANSPPFWRVVIATSHQALGAVILATGAALTLFAYKFAPVASAVRNSEAISDSASRQTSLGAAL